MSKSHKSYRKAWRKGRITAAVAVTAMLASLGPIVFAAPGSSTLRVQVVEDHNGNGTWDDPYVEPGLANVSVTVTSDSGATQTVTTDAGGVATFTGDAGRYIVSVENPNPSKYQSAPAQTSIYRKGPAIDLAANDSFVQVVSGKDAIVTTGFWDPNQYCQSSAQIVGICQMATDSVYVADYFGNGKDVGYKRVATKSQTGVLYGVGWDKQDEKVFASATARRRYDYGSGGSGGIYVMSPNSSSSATLWGTVPDAGTTAHQLTGASAHDDWVMVDKAGKESLGDLDVSYDSTQVQVVNLNTKQLLVYDAASPTMGSPLYTVDLSANPGCSSAADWRPYGLGESNDGILYVGGVCSAESTQNPANLRAIVLSFDAANGYAPLGKVLDQSLNYARQTSLGTYCDGVENHYVPWSSTFACATDATQPILSDIEVDRDGSLILGIRSRMADQSGAEYKSSVDGNFYHWSAGVVSGDITKACKDGSGMFILDTQGGCGIPLNSVTDSASGTVAGEFFTQDGQNASKQEPTEGALAMSPSQRTVATTSLEPKGSWTQGFIRLDLESGLAVDDNGQDNRRGSGNQITQGTASKNAGMGDIEVLCDLAPIQIGNRVWRDTNGDGIQQADELPIAGVTVGLYDSTGALVTTVRTTSTGEYYFSGLTPRSDYTIRIEDRNWTGNPANPGALEGLSITQANQGSGLNADALDSDGVLNNGGPEIAITTGDAGYVNHSLDFGFYQMPPNVTVGDYVWKDTNANGRQDSAESGIPGVVLKLTGPDGNPVADVLGHPVGPVTTDADGHYEFTGLPPIPNGQSYTVTLDAVASADALKGLVPTTANVGNTTGDSSTGSAKSAANLSAGGASDMTLDFGFTSMPSVSVGDLVWFDDNKNGKQDPATDHGIPGVVLNLTGPDGQPVRDIAGDPVGPQTTGPDGTYLFSNLPTLPAGQSYTVTIDAAASATALKGYSPTTPRASGTDSTNDSETGSATSSANLSTNGAQDLTLDFGFIKTPSVSVGDFVWLDADHNGIQDDGPTSGIEGVSLVVFGPDGQPARDVEGVPVPAVKTDADGHYVFTNLPTLPAGQSYTVKIDKAGSGNALNGLVPTLPYAGAATAETDSSDGSAASVADLSGDGSQDMSLDFGFYPAPHVSVGDVVWADTNDNGVQDPGEPGIAGVVLTLTGPDGNPVTDMSGNPVGPQVTDASGSYAFTNLPVLPVGQGYTVTIDYAATASNVLDGYHPAQTGKGTSATDSSKDSVTSTADLSVDGTSDFTLDFGFVPPPPPSVSVGNFVWKDTSRDGTQDAGEPGIPGVVLTLTGPDGKPVYDVKGNLVGPQTTNGSGAYLFKDLPTLPAGKSYTVTLDAVASADALKGLVPTIAGDGSNPLDSSTGSATSAANLSTDGASDLTLDFGFVEAPRVSVGNFVWLDADHNGIQDDGPASGIAGVVITLAGPDGLPVHDVNGDLVGPQTTDGNGEYLFANLPTLPVGQSYTTSIDAAASATALKGLAPTLTGAGTAATDSSTGSAASSVDLSANGAADLTLDYGFYRVPKVSVGDTVWLDQNRDGLYDSATEPGIEDVVLTITGPDGKAVYDIYGNPVGPQKTDANGKYLFKDLPVLLAGQSYTTHIDAVASAGVLAGLSPTTAGDGTNPLDSSTDSSASRASLTVDGAQDLTLDYGFVAIPSVAVGNFVWNDTNADGVQSAGEPGIPGVVLTIVDPDGNPVIGIDGDVVGPQSTSANGEYLFTGLPILPVGKSYKVIIDKSASEPALSGFGPTKTGTGTSATDSSTDFAASSANLSTDGAKDLTLDFGFTRVPRVSVGNFVWFDKNGNGVQDKGEPGIPGVYLTLTGPAGDPVTDVEGNLVDRVVTDANGHYSFEKLPALVEGQHYTVTIDPVPSAPALDGYIPAKSGRGTTATDSSANSADSVVALITDGARDETLDFGFVHGPSVSVGDLVWEDTNGNGVQDAGESGITGVVLKVTGPDGKSVTDVNGDLVGPVTTGPDGKYLFDNLPVLAAGQSYTVTVDAGASATALKGLVPTLASRGTPATDSSTGSAKSGDLTTDGAQDLTVDFGFMTAPEVSVGDLVWEDTNGNGVQDAGEPGIPGVVLKVTGPDGKSVTDVSGDLVGPVTTDAEGKYSFEHLPVLASNQSYTVTIDRLASRTALAGLAPTKTGQGSPGTDSSTGSAKSGDLITNGAKDLTLDFGFASIPRVSVGNFVWFDVNGNGIQDKGEPGIPGVDLTLADPSGNPVVDVEGNPVGPVVTDSKGHYSFEKLPTLPAGQHYTVSIDYAATGTALDGYIPAKSGRGTNASDSSANSADSVVALTTDGAKDMTLDFGFVHGPSVALAGVLWVDTTRDGVQGPKEPVLPGVTLKVVGPDGKPVVDANGNPIAPVRTDKQGRYRFDNLPPLPAGQSYKVLIDTAASAKALKGLTVVKGLSALSGDVARDGDDDLDLNFMFTLANTANGSGELPDTGFDSDARVPWLAGILALLGAALITDERRRRRARG